jgi:rod shape-determining protein MreD
MKWNWLNYWLLFATMFLVLFAEANFTFVRRLLAVQPDLLPALVVYASLSYSFGTAVLLAVVGGLLFDSLSSNPLGSSLFALTLIAAVVHWRRHLILRDQWVAQMVIGLAASALAPLITVLLLVLLNERPMVSMASLWQLLTLTLCGGLATPLCFRFFDWAHQTLNYQPLSEGGFRPDREIVRGRI